MQQSRSLPQGIDGRAAFDAIFDAVAIVSAVRDDHGDIVDFRFDFLNAAASAAFISRGDDLVGSLVGEMFPNVARNGLLTRLRQLVETGTPVSVEVPLTDPVLGNSSWEISASPLGDGAIAVVRDRTEHARIAHESRERELRYRLLADHAGDVAVLSEGGVIQWVGPSITELLGWTPDEVVGRTIPSFIHPDDVNRLFDFRTALDAQDATRVRIRVQRKNGGFRWMENTSRILSKEGLVGTVVSVMWSVEAEVEALEALQRAEAEQARLERRTQQAERLESLGVLAGGIAHDFNNLLVGVLGNAELAREYIDQPDALRILLDQLVAAAERAGELTRQMLDYAGQRSVAPTAVDVGELVTETIGLIRTNLAANAVVQLLVDTSLPWVIADATQLRRAVMNLVINASDALDGAAGEVTIRVGSRRLDEAETNALSPLNPPRPGDFVVVEVTDTGRGMSDETLSRMFEPFFTTAATGRGLGLSVVHGAVRALGGTMETTSELGAGTTMRAYLPAQYEHASEPATKAVAAATSTSAAGTVLVVDDEAIVSTMIRRALESADHQVLVAVDAAAGLEAFRAHPDEFSVAVVDMTMPGMSGAELSSALHEIRPDLPIVLMSGYTADDIAMELTDARFSFLPKPFRLTALLEGVDRAISR